MVPVGEGEGHHNLLIFSESAGEKDLHGVGLGAAEMYREGNVTGRMGRRASAVTLRVFSLGSSHLRDPSLGTLCL